MMATAIRGSNAPDYTLSSVEEAAWLEVVLSLEIRCGLRAVGH